MNQTTTKNQKLFDLHLEYSASANALEKEYREYESGFHHHFGFLPIRIEDDFFLLLTDKQQDQCRAFWSNARAMRARKDMVTARALAAAYFDAYADRNGK